MGETEYSRCVLSHDDWSFGTSHECARPGMKQKCKLKIFSLYLLNLNEKVKPNNPKIFIPTSYLYTPTF